MRTNTTTTTAVVLVIPMVRVAFEGTRTISHTVLLLYTYLVYIRTQYKYQVLKYIRVSRFGSKRQILLLL